MAAPRGDHAGRRHATALVAGIARLRTHSREVIPAPKLALAHLPTPLFRHDALDALVGCEVWVKRDDMTAGPEAGNKIRKLEYLLAAAQGEGAHVVITCGGEQSNHARATALLARRVGLHPLLFLRTPDGATPSRPWHGNLMLDALAGAEIRYLTPAQYHQRDACMAQAKRELERHGQRAYVIPEGGSNGLGAFGYIDAMAEVRRQLDRGEAGDRRRFDVVAHACGSGGTAAGVIAGAALHDVADQAVAIAVCDDRVYFERKIESILLEAEAIAKASLPRVRSRVLDAYRGPAYAVPSEEQARFIVRVARETGLVLDPVYTGKALFGLAQLDPKPGRALFLHTGGLPGLLADAARFSPLL